MVAFEDGGAVTLIFYRIGAGTDMLKEPFLNLLAAAFQMSSFTHVEIAIGAHHMPDTRTLANHTLRWVLHAFIQTTGVSRRKRIRVYGADV